MKILFIGDIVAKPGREAVKKILPKIKSEKKPDFVIANAENLAHGRGATEETIREMQEAGIDYFTGGDHLFWQRGFEDVVDNLPVVRPANYPDPYPGVGEALIPLKDGTKILLINLLGRTSFSSLTTLVEDPFRTADAILEKYQDEKPDEIIIDFHAEATSEKSALGFYLDGKVTAVVGTHTHAPTCDTRVLPLGTMFVTDVGMTGNIDSVLGVKKEIIINLFLTAQKQRFEWENAGKTAFRGVLLDAYGKSIERCDYDI